MWNMPYSPSTFARMTPRERMHASLQGIGNVRGAVEVREQNGAFHSLIQNTLNAPRVGTQVTGGRSHVALGQRTLDLQRTKSLFTPSTAVEPVNSADPVQVTRGFGALGLVSRAGMIPAATPIATAAPSTTPSALPASSTGSKSMKAIVDAMTGKTKESTATRGFAPAASVPQVMPGTTRPTYVSPDAPGSAVQDTSKAPVEDDVMIDNGYAYRPPGVTPTDGNSPVVTVTSAATGASAGLSPLVLAGGAAALFGAIWYFTRK